MAWHTRWQERQQKENKPLVQALMNQTNPCVIPRNHRFEAALKAAEDEEDYRPFNQLHEVLSKPYEELSQDNSLYSLPSKDEERVERHIVVRDSNSLDPKPKARALSDLALDL